jgi:predicted GNAT superfamily acetyltransferase
MTMSAQAAYDAECIANYTCPACQITRTGQVDPRRALTVHLKRLSMTDSAHFMWFRQSYSIHFKHGGSRCIKEVTAADMI